jgi:putative transposase
MPGTRLRKSPRLTHFDYVGAYVYTLTFVTRQRTPILNDADAVAIVTDALARACEKHEFSLDAYCFMPDHLHVLVSGGEEADLTRFVRLFKQLSSYNVKQHFGTPLWQISYYDHVLRTDEDMSRIADYIWDNPVAAGLVRERMEFPYSGPRELMQ